jgi:integrase
MRKLTLPTKTARIVKEITGYWYITWHCPDLQRARFGLNRIKDLNLRQLWADRIVSFINGAIKKGDIFLDTDNLPTDIQPPAFDSQPIFVIDDTVLNYFKRFIKLKKTEGVSDGWIKKWITLQNSLKDYAQENSKNDFLFTELTKDWAINYKAWRYAEPRSHSINTVAKDFSMLRQLIKEAEIEDDLTVEKSYRSKSYKVCRILTDMVAMNGTQLEALLAIEGLPLYLERVRDNFVVACYTALRWGNWSISKHNIIEMKRGDSIQTMLKVPISIKTNDVIYIPLHPVAKNILEKYNYELPVISNQKSNKYLKILADKANLHQLTTLKKSVGGKIVELTKPFYKWVTTHTARRTFVTIGLFEMTIPSALLMKITGHKTEKQLFEYARITSQEAAFELSKYF